MRGAINKEERFMKKLLKSVAALSLSAMMLLSPGVLAEEDEEESNVVELTTVVQEYEGKQIVLKTAGLDILEPVSYTHLTLPTIA